MDGVYEDASGHLLSHHHPDIADIINPDLSIVQENVDVQYPHLPESTAEEVTGAREVTPPSLISNHEYAVHQSPGAQSNISGSTAISAAQTVHDPADLDSDLMLEFLDDLSADAGKILDILAPKTASVDHLASVASEAISPISRVSRVLEKRADRFKEARENFGAGDFINRDTVLASFAGEAAIYESNNAFRRPDSILYKANVATFAKQMVTLAREKLDIFDALLALDNTFPRNFVSSLHDNEQEDSSPGGSSMIEETFTLALDIRTQFAISLLVRDQNEQGFDPDATLQSIFFAVSDEENNSAEGSRLRGWEVLGLGSGDDDLPAPIKETVLRRIARIRQSFRGDQEDLEGGNYLDSERLESEFPWTDFVTRTLDWARLRNVELEDEINALGGVSEIQASLKDHLETSITQPSRKRKHSVSQSQGASTTEPESQSQNIPKTTPGVLSVLRRRLARLSGQEINVIEDEPKRITKERVAANGSASQAASEDYQPPVLEEEEEEDDDSRTFINPPGERSAMQEDLEKLRQREKQNKENMRRLSADPSSTPRKSKSFYDKQPGATRVSFEESQSPPEKNTMSPKKTKEKRKRAPTESEDDEDEFETHVTKNRRRAPVQKQARYVPSSVPPSTAHEQSQARPIPIRRTELQVEDSDDERRPSHAEQLRVATQQARATTYSRATKTRRAWNDEEVNVLTEYVAEFCQATQPWKAIKEADAARGNVLVHRTHVNLKDKARNIVKAHQVAGQALPPGFETLSLGAYHQDDVERRRGIRPEDFED
ncbi:hypothetical protein SLS56_001781 [Neofusicoccum ribis]|uniref:Myb-like domain-containing protein n=1 Tax=Neofusicoccum ribis TaxID=45134 RepID=A0ABR3T771_9PEZI